MALLDKFFKKKPKEKNVVRFWQEFEQHADLYYAILAEGEEGEDYEWLEDLLRRRLNECCEGVEAKYELKLEYYRDPMRIVFGCNGDPVLRQIGAWLEAHYPASLHKKLEFAVEP